MGKRFQVLHALDALSGSGSAKIITDYHRHISRDKISFDFLVYTPPSDEDLSVAKDLGATVYCIPPITKAPFAHLIGLMKVLQSRPYDAVHIHAGAFLSIPYLVFSRMASIPRRIVHAHSTGSIMGSTRTIQLLRRISAPTVRSLATDMVACSPEAGRWVFNTSVGKFSIINNAIESERYSFSGSSRAEYREILGLRDSPVFIFVGRLADEKNPKFLSEIISQLLESNPAAWFLVVGEGPRKADLEGVFRGSRYGDRVMFLGSRNDIPELMSTADVLLPSIFEGFGMVLAEAQANGLPCLASDRVPRSAAFSKQVVFFSLDKNAREWASQANRMLDTRGPGGVPADFELSTAAEALGRFYSRQRTCVA